MIEQLLKASECASLTGLGSLSVLVCHGSSLSLYSASTDLRIEAVRCEAKVLLSQGEQSHGLPKYAGELWAGEDSTL